MDNNYLQKLAAALMRTNTGAGAAANALNSREYQLYAQEAKAMGEQIMTPQQFAMQKQAPAPQPVQQAQPAPEQPFRF